MPDEQNPKTLIFDVIYQLQVKDDSFFEYLRESDQFRLKAAFKNFLAELKQKEIHMDPFTDITLLRGELWDSDAESETDTLIVSFDMEEKQ